MRRASRLLAALLALSLASPAWPQAQGQPAPGPASTAQDGDVQPKFIWGLLIQFAISKLSNYAFEAFQKWLSAKLEEGLDPTASAASLGRDSGARVTSRAAAATPAALPSAPAPIVVGDPDKPLVADGKKENYQGLHVALMMSEQGGQRFVFRPVSAGFRTGERFKLRVISTFGGELTIENINPRGERRQIFPARADQVVTLQPGSETLVPMDPSQFFEFSGATGKEQLVINLSDRRAVGAAASHNKVFRQDTAYGSNFLQETADGTYPRIEQAVELVHSAN